MKRKIKRISQFFLRKTTAFWSSRHNLNTKGHGNTQKYRLDNSKGNERFMAMSMSSENRNVKQKMNAI